MQILLIANFVVCALTAWFFISSGNNAATKMLGFFPLVLAIFDLFAYLGMAFPNVNWY